LAIHKLACVSAQLPLIALFLQLDLDFLCIVRTAPSHSWRNPIERVMATLNLGMQCIGLMRDKMDETFEEESAECNGLTTLRERAKRVSGFKDAVLDSIAHLKCLKTLLKWLQLINQKLMSCGE